MATNVDVWMLAAANAVTHLLILCNLVRKPEALALEFMRAALRILIQCNPMFAEWMIADAAIGIICCFDLGVDNDLTFVVTLHWLILYDFSRYNAAACSHLTLWSNKPSP